MATFAAPRYAAWRGRSGPAAAMWGRGHGGRPVRHAAVRRLLRSGRVAQCAPCPIAMRLPFSQVAIKRLHALDDDSTSSGAGGSAGGTSGGHGSGSGGGGGGASRAAFQQFFEREIAILASIRHPNVVNFIGACHRSRQRCLVTEYCARGSLDKLLHKSGAPLDLPKRIEFALDVARGMACLHAQSPMIIHRDLKTAVRGRGVPTLPSARVASRSCVLLRSAHAHGAPCAAPAGACAPSSHGAVDHPCHLTSPRLLSTDRRTCWCRRATRSRWRTLGCHASRTRHTCAGARVAA